MPRTSKKRSAGRTAPASATPVPVVVAASAPSPGQSLRQLAHELNSLLDGSMRCVGLARTSLQQNAGKAPASIETGLSNAHAAMKHMAALLERAMKQTGSESASPQGAAMFDSSQTLRQLIDDLTGLLQPHAHAAKATLRFDVADDCNALAAGALGPVLMNGLRNALQGCESCAHSDDSHEVVVTIARDGATLTIAIAGPAATKPTGHRIGLALSSQIVDEMDGELALVTDSGVTTLRGCVPIANLNRHA